MRQGGLDMRQHGYRQLNGMRPKWSRFARSASCTYDILVWSKTHPVHGELLIMPLLMSEIIPDNVFATQNALGLPVAVGLSQPLPRGCVD